MVIKDPIILKCQEKVYPVETLEQLEKVILLPAKIKDANGIYVANPAIIGGFDSRTVEVMQANQAKLLKWGKTNQKYLETINADNQDIEVERDGSN